MSNIFISTCNDPSRNLESDVKIAQKAKLLDTIPPSTRLKLEICIVEIINIIFRLGVILAIFSFVWGLIQFGITLIGQGFGRKLWQYYLLKGIQYVFLIQTTLLFTHSNDTDLSLSKSSAIVSSLVLLFYFLSKLQNRQKRKSIIQMVQNGRSLLNNAFDIHYEKGLLIFGTVVTVVLLFAPEWISNPVSLWFYDVIVDIEDTPIFGFVFKVIGFFFLLSVFNKLIQSILILINPSQSQPPNDNPPRDDNSFDDYEEIKE